MSQIKCPRCGNRIASVVAQKVYVSGMRLANQQVIALACPRCFTVIDTKTMPSFAAIPDRVPVRGDLLNVQPGHRAPPEAFC